MYFEIYTGIVQNFYYVSKKNYQITTGYYKKIIILKKKFARMLLSKSYANITSLTNN